MSLKHTICPDEKSLSFYLSSDVYCSFEIPVSFGEIKYFFYTNGYFCTPKDKIMICYEASLASPLTMLHGQLKRSFSGQNRIRPELFEQGVGHYLNMREAYIDEEGEDLPDIDDRFPSPALNGNSLDLWSTPYSFRAYQTWMYQNQGVVYIEFACMYEWDECDASDQQQFQVFMKDYRFQRFVISKELAQEWLEYAYETRKYSKHLNELLSVYLQTSHQGSLLL